MQAALQELKAGRPIILMDDPERENEGDLILPASALTDELLLFFLRNSTGQVCVAMSSDIADRLQIPLMTFFNTDANKTAFCVSVDLTQKHGITTGVSVADRVKTIRALANPETQASDLTRPGHVFPLRAHPDGLRGRRGHTEGSVTLCQLADTQPVAVIVELMNVNGAMMRYPECLEFSKRYTIPLVMMSELVTFCMLPKEIEVQPLRLINNTARLPISSAVTVDMFSDFESNIQTFTDSSCMYVVVTKGSVSGKRDVPLRIHSQCLTGDVLCSSRCDCGSQLRKYLSLMSKSECAILIYVVGHEGRGIGLPAKVLAYQQQDNHAADTVIANSAIGCPVDIRSYHQIVNILNALQVKTVHLYTGNPDKVNCVASMLSQVSSLDGVETVDNAKYLETKRTKLFPLIKTNKKIGVIYTTSWHTASVAHMVQQCRDYFRGKEVDLVEQTVSGAFELVMGARSLIRKGCQSVIAIGILLKGETYHFDIIADTVTSGLMTLQLQEGIPIVLGLLVCYTEEQIKARVFGEKNSVEKWCEAAMEMA